MDFRHHTKKVADPTDKHVGSRVRMRRMMLGMSQGVLAESLGLTFQQVQKYEKGANRIGASRMQQIAHTLKVPVSFFFEGGPKESPDGTVPITPAQPDYVSEFLATSTGLALAKAFVGVTDNQMRHSIVQLVTQIATNGAASEQRKAG